MKHVGIITIVMFTFLGCSSTPETTKEAKTRLDETFTEKIGSTTKTELVEIFGNAEWCKVEDSQIETCRFYRKRGVKWIGEKNQKDKKPIEQSDQIIAEFDKEGILRAFKVTTQR